MVAVALPEEAVTVAEDEATLPKARSRRASAPLVTGERYELGETIGRGGMGEVKSARDTRILRDVAVKVVRDPRDHALLARFVREARVQGGLEHPAVARHRGPGSLADIGRGRFLDGHRGHRGAFGAM